MTPKGGPILLAPIDPSRIDPVVASICAALQARGFAAYLVGGAVRDLLRGESPTDWDIATVARPEEVMALFPDSLPTGIRYGTVTVRRGGRSVEVTAFRGEGAYGDGRHPDSVTFGASIEEDLGRRDFTVNAMAYDPIAGRLVDPYGGLRDLRRKVLRTAGDPAERFAEDALRMLRFYRFAATLGLRPDQATARAVDPALLSRVSMERIRDEFSKTLLAGAPLIGLDGLVSSGLLATIVPELFAGELTPGSVPSSFSRKRGGRGVSSYVRHALAAVEAIRPALHLRLAALLHDIGKPFTRSMVQGEVHFYGHNETGAEIAAEILARLRYPNDLNEAVGMLVRLHMFQLPVHPSDAALRRLLNKAGSPDRLRDLVELRRADIVATGRTCWQSAVVWQELQERAEEVLAAGAAFSLRDLAIDGEDVMRLTGLGPGPEVGRILASLLEKVLEDPDLNERAKLETMAREIQTGASKSEPLP